MLSLIRLFFWGELGGNMFPVAKIQKSVIDIKKLKAKLFSLWFMAIVIGLLVSCGSSLDQQTSIAQTPIVTEEDALITVDIDATASVEDLEEQYDATAIVFKPDAGFAILEKNTFDVLTIDDSDIEVGPSGWTTWAWGWTTWAWGGNKKRIVNYVDNQKAWDLIKLDNAQAIAPNLGKGIKVAVIDTGIDVDLPALEGKLVKSSKWKDFIDGGAPGESIGNYKGHGTAVAGIVLQVAPNATIMPIRVLNGDGRGNLADVIKAIDWAITKEADIINLSLGSYKKSHALKQMTRIAHEQGILMVVSAGNRGKSVVSFPARYTQNNYETRYTPNAIISVGSVTNKVRRSSFSNYGSKLNIVAPGQSITSIFPHRRKARVSGTSFATPMVAGALALALGEMNNTEKVAALPYLKEKLISTANSNIVVKNNQDVSWPNYSGLLNIEAFLESVLAN